METKVKKKIEELAEKSAGGTADDALKFTQAALNLSHVLQVLHQFEPSS